MSSITSTSPGIPVGNMKAVLRGSDLLKEAESMPAEVSDFGNGVVVEKRGNFFKMTGAAKMSLRAKVVAYEAAKIGGKAGQAMFETYRKNNAEEFGDAAVARDKALLEGQPLPPSEEPAPPGHATRVDDNKAYIATGDKPANVTGGRNVNIIGGAANDFLTALYNATIFGLAGQDRLSAQDKATLDGGEGDDVLSAGKDSILFGGAGNDRLSAGRNAVADGGWGDDRIETTEEARVTDAGGDNDIHVYGDSRVTTGAGNDNVHASENAVVDAGDGYNAVWTGDGSTVTTGGGDDTITTGESSRVVSGAGDDRIKAGRDSDVVAGAGDDRVIVDGNATIHFNRGDGHDSVGGSEFGQAYYETDRLSSSILSFGAGIVPADLSMQRQGNDLVIQVGSDSLTLKDVQRHGIPTMTFTDGSTLRAEQVEAVVGPAEPYQPASQVMQRFHDAARAYRTQVNTTGTAV